MRRLIALGLVALLPAGCGEEPAERESAVAARGGAASGGDAAPANDADWLAITDKTDPALWLARRAAAPAAPGDAQVKALREALAQARAHFVEDPRMVANRTAQLGVMLAEIGEPEDPAALVTELTRVAEAGAQRQLYGEMCQHYVNIRRAGTARETALAQLRERYGTQGRR